MKIISRDLWELSENSIKILEFFIKFFLENTKMLLFWQFLSDAADYYKQTDTFVKTVSSDLGGLKM